jgi:predicted O-methyltransferase YrrM
MRNKDLVYSIRKKCPHWGQNESEILELLSHIDCLDRKRSFLEIGTQYGGTYDLLTRLFDKKCISLDLPYGKSGGAGRFVRANVKRQFLGLNKCYFVDGDSHDEDSLNKVREFLGQDPLDLLFIDGDHSFEGTKKDYEIYSPLVRKGGLVIFHDVGDSPINNNTDCECRRFFLGLEGKKVTIDHQTSWTNNIDRIGGIGVLFK